MSLFAWLLFFLFVVPFALSFGPKVAFYKSWGRLFAGIALAALLFIFMNGRFEQSGVIGFNSDYLGHIRWNGLPPEEWLFFVILPFCGTFIYALLKVNITTPPFGNQKHHITLFFLVAAFFLALFNSTQVYTFYHCLIAAVLLSIHYLFLRKEWIGHFWMAFFIYLVLFFAMGGVLTGMVTDKPLIWYNDTETIGVRLFTIPVEETFYALTGFLLPVTVMELLSGKIKRKRK
ncbi:MAG: lycopene cyclase domain-containing protein [Bacteroidota bacterium]